MRIARVIGDNIKLLLQQKNIEKKVFAEAMGYSPYDIAKICDGRLFITDEQLNKIASFFHVSKEVMMKRCDENQYTGAGFMECMGTFKKEDNKDKVLDILDMYCDLKETLND